MRTDAGAPRRVAPALILTERMVMHWRLHPMVPLQSVLVPTLLLLTYHLVVSRSMTLVTGSDNLATLVPMSMVAGTMMGTLNAGFHIPGERDSGLLSRLWIMPVHRGSFLVGTVMAEVAQTLVASFLILLVGMALGLRFEGSWPAVIPLLLMPMLVTVVFTAIVIAIAVRTHSASLLTLLGGAAIGMAFCTGGVAPLEHFPEWIQPFAQIQPLTPVIDAMRALIRGEPAGRTLLTALAWLIGLGAVFGPLAVRGYRSAAQSGGSG
ncbi:ABC transporter permease [Mycobacterium sp. CVI_P3]|uniref:ABC transporter permease n=1 Tax=Mycobacterium pinniadriaticum TaxID=2994102 RepID=A0ABT3SHI1_9MYCO|nr:ABC transporter permease [Mycobacterium pinniadriaticum]MCX2932570.1 ABC transporter permease [Mycobacterium pinniadriaticum]MCX2938986.1 ABC transporter permease [Mycobacterium pinniadriaticum]